MVLPHPVRRGGPFAHAVHGEKRRFREGRGEERAGGVRLVMLGVQQLALVSPQSRADLAVHEKLFLDPQRPRHPKRREPLRCHAEVGLQNALELEERLVVEADEVQLRRCDAADGEAVPGCLEGKRRVPLLAGEALLLRRRDDLAVPQQTRRAVVIERREPKDVTRGHGHSRVLHGECQFRRQCRRWRLSASLHLVRSHVASSSHVWCVRDTWCCRRRGMLRRRCVS